MRRRRVLRAVAVAGTAGGAGCRAGRTGTDRPAFREGFEEGLGNWTVDAAIGPEVDPAEFEWTVDVSDEQAAAGERSLRIRNEGDHDDGTTWAAHPVSVEPGRAYTATGRGSGASRSRSTRSATRSRGSVPSHPPARGTSRVRG